MSEPVSIETYKQSTWFRINTLCCAFNFQVLSTPHIFLYFLKISLLFTCIASFKMHGVYDTRIKEIKYVVNVSVLVGYAIPSTKV